MSPVADARQPDQTPEKPASRQAGVPRRFGVGTLLLITAMYAVLFSFLRLCDSPPEAFLLIAIFFTGVGLGQMLLFKGRNPRRASWLVGACLLPCMMVGVELYNSFRPPGGHLSGPEPLPAFCCCSVISGAIYGYLAGLLIAGVFLVAGGMRRVTESRNAASPAADSSGAAHGDPFLERNTEQREETRRLPSVGNAPPVE
jgi:hypothetical protein